MTSYNIFIGGREEGRSIVLTPRARLLADGGGWWIGSDRIGWWARPRSHTILTHITHSTLASLIILQPFYTYSSTVDFRIALVTSFKRGVTFNAFPTAAHPHKMFLPNNNNITDVYWRPESRMSWEPTIHHHARCIARWMDRTFCRQPSVINQDNNVQAHVQVQVQAPYSSIPHTAYR